jgi:hypothetical protein
MTVNTLNPILVYGPDNFFEIPKNKDNFFLFPVSERRHFVVFLF